MPNFLSVNAVLKKNVRLPVIVVSLLGVVTFGLVAVERFTKPEYSREYQTQFKLPDGPLHGSSQMQAAHAFRFKVGDQATPFSTSSLDGENYVAFEPGRLNVLVFGSFSCNLFCDNVNKIEAIYQKHRDRVHFLFINISEAGHVVPGLEFALESKLPTTSLATKKSLVRRAMNLLEFTLPTALADTESIEKTYHAFPSRILVIDERGCVALDFGLVTTYQWDLSKLDRLLSSRN